MLKKKSNILLILLALSLIVTFQNCGQSEQSGLFGSNCNGDKCSLDPNSLAMELDTQLLQGGIFKISTNPSSGFTNLRLTGKCESAGYNRSLVKAKIYQCIGSNCSSLKHIKATSCSSEGLFEIASTVSNLTPGPHKLYLEIVGIDDFGQEVYGIKSKLPAITMDARQTIKPPVLASISGTNFWAQDKIYYFPSSTEKVVLDGYITGFCDYNASSTYISVKLSVQGSSTYSLLGSTNCQLINAGSSYESSPNRQGRTGFFELNSFSIYMTYTGGSFVTCSSGDVNCQNNVLNKMTNRLVALALTQQDLNFNYEVYSIRKLLLHYKGERSGKGWLSEPLAETLKRVKRSFNFSSTNVAGDLSGAQGVNDYSQAYRLLTSVDEFYDPLVTSGDQRYGFGTRAFITRWLLGSIEDISSSIYNTTNIFFLGSEYTIPYRAIGVPSGNNTLLCSGNASISDPITGVVGTAATAEAGIERVALCLSFRYLNGLFNMNYTEALKIVQDGVMFTNSNSACFFKTGAPLTATACGAIMDILTAAASAKARSFPYGSLSSASSTQMKYFGNSLTQFYINKIMINLAYRNGSGENEIFASIFQSVYPEITDLTFRRSLYPTEYNYIGSTASFGGTRSRQYPDGSTTFTYTGP